MDNLPENVRIAFEQYINGFKKEALETLIPGSKYHTYLSIIDNFKTSKGKVTAKTKELLSKYQKSWPGQDFNKLELQSLLLEFDQATKEQDKAKILTQIDQSFVNGYYEYSKPAEIKAVQDTKSKRRGKSIKSKAKNIFEQDKFYNEEDTLIKMYKTNFELGNLNRSLINKVDFTRINNRSFEAFMTSYKYLSEVTEKSFMTKLISYLKDKYKANKHFMIPT